ncbi:hypothetical protein CVT24_004109 [Panaeolus cyanescens]|uniref:Amino acid permease/ SLC12A domain-containing protein n=1 Tax=Panaeolus cyanescens TaxID=181874 RepID=A0A409Y5Z6_9AGAR|nr:hypothetical protein CVT24_004109 [Panaeolus cyanescens]
MITICLWSQTRLKEMEAPDGHSRRASIISMIALAGMIGTGLFLSTGRALAQSGPLGCVLAFAVMGTITASIGKHYRLTLIFPQIDLLLALISAEMSAFKPAAGGFVRHATLWFDKSMGIAIGWNFWYAMAITMPTEITAATVLLGYWFPNINQAIPITVFLVIIAIINFSPVQIYGEFEFYFAICKITLIIWFIIVGVLCDVGVVGQDRIGFRYWNDPFPLFNEHIIKGLPGKLLGFWATMLFAAFAFGNVQVVAIAGAETKNPRRAIPAALKQTFWRILVFYVASVFVISLLVPANDEHLRLGTDTVAHSPFVIAFDRLGSKASAFNAVVITSAFSSGNSCTFLASRTLHGMALDGHAPQMFLRLNRYQVPYVSVGVTAAWGLVAYSCLNKGAFQYYGLLMIVLILSFCGLEAFIPTFKPAIFISSYFNSLAFPLLYFALKRWNGDSLVTIDQESIEEELATIEKDRWKENTQEGATYDRILNSIF